MNLKNKTFLITGAASGIGRATSILLSSLGADLILLDVNGDGLRSTLKECKETDFIDIVDLSNIEKLVTVVKEAVEKKGAINGFAHIAGIPCIAPLKAISKQMAQKILDINTIPALELAKIFSNKKYYKENACSMVFISSVYANVGSAANVLYSMSKSALHGITKSLAIELAKKNIRVNCIAPGFIKTEMVEKVSGFFEDTHVSLLEKMHPLGLGTPQDIANAIVFLLSDSSKWITGTILNVDGGFCAQ